LRGQKQLGRITFHHPITQSVPIAVAAAGLSTKSSASQQQQSSPRDTKVDRETPNLWGEHLISLQLILFLLVGGWLGG